jgi:glyoxylase-like metal-dependent hydrolase (beta-lactamase superfamily II)
MIIESREAGPFGVNWYLVACEKERKAVVIDPGADVELIFEIIQSKDLHLKYILNTHGHVDHMAGVKQLQQMTGTPFYLHPGDRIFLDELVNKAAMFGLETQGSPTLDGELNDGDEIQVGQLRLSVIHTPGHSPGGVAFLCEDKLFVGDTLFQGSIGRTDFPGGDYNTLINSIKEKLFPLGDDMIVYPGHGPQTTIAIEKVHNPFLNGQFEPTDPSML